MAHECPDCGVTCHCGGDIDDINFGEGEACEHCFDRLYGEKDEEYEEEDDFTPCNRCDGHDACRDFGCAIDLGIGKMVRNEPTGNDWD